MLNRSGDIIGSATSNEIAAILDFTDRSNNVFSVNLYKKSQLNVSLYKRLKKSFVCLFYVKS